MKKNPKVMTKTKQDLIDAFWTLYCEKRIEKITVKEITQKAGYNRSTFYEYFIDIYDVLEQIETSIIPNVNELPPIAMLEGNLGMPLDIFMELYEKNHKYYSVLLGDNGDAAFASKLKNSIKPMLQEALKYQVKISEKELDFILEYILSAMIGIMSYWFKQDKVISNEKLISLINEIMENGVMSILSK
ncbi:TetR/AcrR family transcriptional regulator [Clostridium cylindrosporum]|uniref:Transcriptional regulator, TetR family n=1 Tax=Clostridium cylindrosporum DSM 605 TaxID=1121307 RepID=A0A0J8DGK9_CLOCY|nr:TetR/AcrR family transcriptional regulator [Clostridium cylindrosporum]KMT23318.1 transcriptional regulator, TetR family [Clostridium cylindrosporum DSM 605]